MRCFGLPRKRKHMAAHIIAMGVGVAPTLRTRLGSIWFQLGRRPIMSARSHTGAQMAADTTVVNALSGHCRLDDRFPRRTTKSTLTSMQERYQCTRR
jgi:hypothetical protein